MRLRAIEPHAALRETALEGLGTEGHATVGTGVRGMGGVFREPRGFALRQRCRMAIMLRVAPAGHALAGVRGTHEGTTGTLWEGAAWSSRPAVRLGEKAFRIRR